MKSIAKLLFASWAFAACAVSIAGALDVRVRPTLPPEITTVQQAIGYYLEPSGYQFVAEDPAYGDFRDLASRPVQRTAPDNQPLAISAAILAILPESVVLYVDVDQQRVVLGRRPASANDHGERVHLLRTTTRALPDEDLALKLEEQVAPAPAASEPSPFEDEKPEPAPVPATDAPEPAAVAETSVAGLVAEAPAPATPMPVAAPVEPTPEPAGFTLYLEPGERLSVQLAQQTPKGYQVVWRAPDDLVIGAHATIHGASFEEVVVSTLRALWHTESALIVKHHSNNVLRIVTP